MRRDRLGLIVTGLLFAGWLGFLAYLTLTKTNPIVVSRSQVMSSTHYVLAEVRVDSDGRPEKLITIVQDLRPQGDPLDPVVNVTNIRDARIAGAEGKFKEKTPYLLMLTRTNGEFVVTPPPRAPGHEAASRGRPWVYPWDGPGVREQFESLVPARRPD